MVEIIEGNFTGREHVKRFAKQMLKNTIFIGTFHEKRFVECLDAYRDVVCISSNEADFIQNLVAVKKRIEGEFVKLPWIGITDPHGIGTPAGYNLWVELHTEIFGQYWFKVKTVDFHINQITLKLEVVRPIKNENSIYGNMLSPTDGSSEFSFNTSLSSIQFWMQEILGKFCNIITTQNIKHSIIFTALLLSTLVLSAVDIIKYLLEYSLKLINGLSNLIHSSTPIVINFFNVCGKIIFGLFHLIVLLFKSNPTPPPVYNAYINYDPKKGMPNSFIFDKTFPKALPSAPNRSRATIKPIY